MNLLTVKQVAEKLQCATSFVWTLNKKDPSFPKPIQIGLGGSRARATRWVDDALNEWLQSKQQEGTPHDNEDGRSGQGVRDDAGEVVTA